MRPQRHLLPLVMGAAFLLAACSERPTEIVGTPRFAAHVQPIFTNFCVPCHTGPTGPELPQGMNLSQGQAYASIVNVPSIQAQGFVRVAPGDAEASYLFNKLRGTHLDLGGEGTAMPPPGMPQPSTVQVNTIRDWIAAGALND